MIDKKHPNNVDQAHPTIGHAVVVMGVAGSGKTTLAALLAGALGARFHDADDFHDAQSVAKMRAGVPLSDDDRAPWLVRLNAQIQSHVTDGENVVLACSALKAGYRQAILRDVVNSRLVFLDGDYDTIATRIRARSATSDHYMPESLLRSQFDALERPQGAIVVDVSLTSDAQLACVLASLESST